MARSAAPSLTLRQLFARNVRVVRVNAGISQERLADEVVCPLRPPDLGAVGRWYEDFAATSEDEVLEALVPR